MITPRRTRLVRVPDLHDFRRVIAALLAAEQGKVAPPSSFNDQAWREDVVEQVTRQVIERMTDTAVKQVVLDAAERLVREEIERIKGRAR